LHFLDFTIDSLTVFCDIENEVNLLHLVGQIAVVRMYRFRMFSLRNVVKSNLPDAVHDGESLQYFFLQFSPQEELLDNARCKKRFLYY